MSRLWSPVMISKSVLLPPWGSPRIPISMNDTFLAKGGLYTSDRMN
jgi:hypothetical protein